MSFGIKSHMPSGTTEYSNLDGSGRRQGGVAWYWRTFGVAASWLILGGFLTLLWQFDGTPDLRVDRTFLGIFSIALLVAGFSLTLVICIAVRDKQFQAEGVLTPAFSSCSISLLSVFFAFIVSKRYSWNIQAGLATVFTAMSTVIYGALLAWNYYRLNTDHRRPLSEAHIPLAPTASRRSSIPQIAPSLYHGDTYSTNYVANMYPTSRARSTSDLPSGRPSESSPRRISAQYADQQFPPLQQQQPAAASHSHPWTEDELQRQQMLGLLSRQERAGSPASRAHSSYHIDWQAADEDPLSAASRRAQHPYDGYYAPQVSAVPARGPPTSYMPIAQLPQTPHQPPPPERTWDGRGRSHSDVPQQALHPAFRDARTIPATASREQRRLEIERGGR